MWLASCRTGKVGIDKGVLSKQFSRPNWSQVGGVSALEANQAFEAWSGASRKRSINTFNKSFCSFLAVQESILHPQILAPKPT